MFGPMFLSKLAELLTHSLAHHPQNRQTALTFGKNVCLRSKWACILTTYENNTEQPRKITRFSKKTPQLPYLLTYFAHSFI